MKLRQKLAMVLASAMVITAVPVTTMAATNNTIGAVGTTAKGETLGYTKEDLVFNPGANQTTGATYSIAGKTPKLTLTFTENHTANEANGETSFISIAEGKFTDEAFLAAVYEVQGLDLEVDADGVIVNGPFAGKKPAKAVNEVAAKLELTIMDKDGAAVASAAKATLTKRGGELRLELPNAAITKGDYVVVPLYIQAGEKDNVITVTTSATGVISGGKYSLTGGEIGAKTLTATVGDATVVEVEGGTIAPITIRENVIGKLAGQKVKIALPHSSDLEFYGQNIKATGSAAYAGKEVTGLTWEYGTDSRNRTDFQTIIVTLPNWTDANATGSVKLTGIYVGPSEAHEDAELGDVTVTISGDNLAEVKDVKVATVKDYVIGVTCAEPAKIVAGKTDGKVKFKLVEDVKDTLVKGRKVEFKIENGFIGLATDTDNNGHVIGVNGYDAFMDLVDDKKITLPDTVKKDDITYVDVNEKGQIVGFEVRLNNIKSDEANSMEFEVPVMTDVENTGEVKVVAEGRSIGGKLEAETIATITAPIKVEIEEAVLKAGLNGQVAGKLTITETDKNMLDKGWITVYVDNATGISFDRKQDLKFTAEGFTVDKDTVKAYSDRIEFKVTRTSKEAGSITIEDLKFNVDRTAPEGSFDIAIYGDALSENVFLKEGMDEYPVEDFITIGTKNTEDLPNAARAKEIILTANSKTYTVNGVEKTADAAVEVVAGRTMVPVRLVADEFGKVDFGTINGVGTVTVFKDGNVLQFQNGSNIMNKNGILVPMDAKCEIKAGRTYIPVKYVADGLGISYTYDEATKSVTFTNQVK